MAASVAFVVVPESVIIVVVKFPLPSLATIVETTFDAVAVVAEFNTFPAVEMVDSLLSIIAAALEMSEFTIKLVVKFPNESL